MTLRRPVVAAIVLLASALAGVEPSLPTVGSTVGAASTKARKATAPGAARSPTATAALTDVRVRSYPS